MESSGLLSSSVKQIQQFLEQRATDADKYHQLYRQLRDEPEIDEENLATKAGVLTSHQIYLLKMQIISYRHWIRGLPVPQGANINTLSNANLWQTEKDRLAQRALTFYREKIDRDRQLKNALLGKPNIPLPHEDTVQQKNYRKEMHNIITHHRQNLKQLLQHKQDLLTTEAKAKLELEISFLNAHELYLDTKDRVVERIINFGASLDDDFLNNSSSEMNGHHLEHNPQVYDPYRPNGLLSKALIDRTMFRREKVHRSREHVLGNRVEKLENQMKVDYERRKRMKHKEFMQQLTIHHNEFLEYHKRKMKQLKKRAVQTKNTCEALIKKKEEIEDKAESLRINALKHNDMDKYLELIKESKNQKIQELLNQTNNFLQQLGAKVLLQKGQTNDDAVELDVTKKEDIDESFKNANKVYYNLTHTIKQEITRQPTLLVGGELKPYQIIGLQWLVSLYNNNLNGILADEMGLGKTIQTISLLSYLIEFKKNYGPFLIIVPLSTMSNWESEFNTWAPSIKKIVYKGTKGNRHQMAKLLKTSKWNVCITTYDYVLRDRVNLNKYEWKYIVIDEGHRMKNVKSKFAAVLSNQYQSDHRLLLTGTPLQNNLGELWALLNFLLPKVFSSCDDFEKWFSMPISKVAGSESVELTEEEQLLIINRLHQVLRPFLLRRVKKEVQSELPDKIEHVIKVELSSWQKLIYKNITQRGAHELDTRASARENKKKAVMNIMQQLRKICNHPFLFLNNYEDLPPEAIVRSSGKFQLLDRILMKLIHFKHRVLIFSQMTTTMDIMQEYFNYRGIKHLRLDGATKSDDRGERTVLFNREDSEYDVFLLSTRAGGLGLNLQTADTVIIFDSDWNPQMDLQAQDRAHRIGQKKEVLVLRLVTNTWIEEEILAKAAYKKGLDQIYIQGGLYNLRSSEAERRQKIEDLLKEKNNLEFQESNDEIPGDELINKWIARDEVEFDAYTRLDEERYDRDSQTYKYFSDPRISEKKINYRLYGEQELPEWLAEGPKPEEEVKEYGRGNRQRKRVNYNDDLTDLQIEKLIEEEGEDSKELRLAEKQIQERSRDRRLVKVYEDPEDEESESEVD